MVTRDQSRIRPEIHFGLIVVVTLSFWAAHSLSVYLYGTSLFAQNERNVRMLATVLPELERSRVRVWRDEPGCRGIENATGDHGEATNERGCPLSPTRGGMGTGSRREFDTIEVALRATGVSVRAVDARYGMRGDITLARFRVECAACSTRDYVFFTSQDEFDRLLTPTRRAVRISTNWFMLEDR